MTVAFVRQLGAESGVQLNPLRDSSEIPSLGNDDQVMGIAMRALRGRIDRPFKVDRSNVYKRLGKGESVRVNALNEAFVHVVEALNNGVYEVVVQRMTGSAAKIKWIHASADFAYSVADDRDNDAMIAIRHFGCHNDGIRVAFHADQVGDDASKKAAKLVSFRVSDVDGNVLIEVKGSLDPNARDEFNQSLYLPDVVSSQSDDFEIFVKAGAEMKTDSAGYGYDAFGQEKYAASDILVAFDEGATTYTAQDCGRFRDALAATPFDYAYIAGGGTQDPNLIPQLAQLAFATNRQLRIDVPGNLGVDAAIKWAGQFNLGASQAAHLIHVFWAPLKSDDPVGLSGGGFYGTSAYNIALACARNAQKNGKGFAPKNYPIAGREYPISRTRIVQAVQLTSQQLNALAKAKINPVVYETFTGGGRYVFRDSLTSALVDSSLKKLISVADMSTSIDEAVTRAGKDMLQLPMQVAIKKMEDFLTTHFDAAEASGWLVPSNAPEMKGKAWQFSVKPNEVRPYDVMDVQYWLRYDGVARQIMVTQTITR